VPSPLSTSIKLLGWFHPGPDRVSLVPGRGIELSLPCGRALSWNELPPDDTMIAIPARFLRTPPSRRNQG
jgi:hypothetical protein